MRIVPAEAVRRKRKYPLCSCWKGADTPETGGVEPLRRDFSGSALPCPLAELPHEAAGFAWMLRAVQSLPPKELSTSTPGVSPRTRQPATGLPGSYTDRTC